MKKRKGLLFGRSVISVGSSLFDLREQRVKFAKRILSRCIAYQ